MKLTPVAGALGAEVSGIDLSSNYEGDIARRLRTAFLEHQVLFFRDQQMSPDHLLRFARIFGEPDDYPFITGLPEAPWVIEILKTERDCINFGGSWHSDTPYLQEPSLGSVLYALEAPDVGGDTLFANAALAYESLSVGLQRLVGRLVGVNSSQSRYPGGRAAAMAKLEGMKHSYRANSQVHISEHPVVRTHPETGRKALYLNRSHTHQFKGMSVAESQPLINFLAEQVIRPEFTCRFRWSPGSLAVWDNRTTQYRALNDYPGKRRRMHRVTIKGDQPY